MRLRHGEEVLKTIKRHPTPFVFRMLKIGLVALPLYFIIYFIGREAGGEIGLVLFAIFSFALGLIVVLVVFDYALDRLIITNKRVVWINWKSLIRREEHEAELLDIQDIETREKGILSKLHMFDYGFFEIETAASKTCILFPDCPDPEGVKHYLLSQQEKVRGGINEKRSHEPDEEWSVN